jgi:hypothetical protein
MREPDTVPDMSAVEILNQIRALPSAERQAVVGKIWVLRRLLWVKLEFPAVE